MNDKQTGLLKKAEESLQAAKLLKDNGMYDIAISRAYYAMFHVAQAILLLDNLSFAKHSGVISAFGQHFAKTGRVPSEFHRYLIEGQDSRSIADYSLDSNPKEEKVDVQIEHAQAFIELGRKMLTPENE